MLIFPTIIVQIFKSMFICQITNSGMVYANLTSLTTDRRRRIACASGVAVCSLPSAVRHQYCKALFFELSDPCPNVFRGKKQQSQKR